LSIISSIGSLLARFGPALTGKTRMVPPAIRV